MYKKAVLLVLLIVSVFAGGCSDDDAGRIHSVAYAANGATGGSVPVDNNLYAAGDGVTVLSNSGNLVKNGSTFAGWNSAADGNGTNYAAGETLTMPATNLTLYAKWNGNPYTVTFDRNDDAATGTMSAQTINSGASAALTANAFSKPNFTFAGWAVSPSGDVVYTDQQSFTMGASNVTLYAKWTINRYPVTFDSQGADTAATPQSITVDHGGTAASLPTAPVKAGYTFGGWFTETGGNGSAFTTGTVVTNALTVYAKWSGKPYTITFNKNNVTATGTMAQQTINCGQSAPLTANGFSKSQFTFVGWATSSIGDVAYTNQQRYTMGPADVTLYAIWTFNRYTVTFDSQGGSSVASQTVYHGDKITAPEDPVWDYRQVQGWYTDTSYTTRWDFALNKVISNMTLYAKWFDERDMVSVPGGTYLQQDTEGNSFEHTVSGFLAGKYEVTYNLWYTVYSWATNNGYTFANAGMEGVLGSPGAVPTATADEPVTRISWRDAMVWCNAYSQMTGLTPVYCSDSGFNNAVKTSSAEESINTNEGSYDNPFANWSANGYRLLTEGEWQYAASYQDGSSWTPYNYASGATADYNDAAATGAVAWYLEHSTYTQDVGTKAANQLGIHDMSGNVIEWCWDRWGAWPTGSQTDYRGENYSHFHRILRGGHFNVPAEYQQVGYRVFPLLPHDESQRFGFRVARSGE